MERKDPTRPALFCFPISNPELIGGNLVVYTVGLFVRGKCRAGFAGEELFSVKVFSVLRMYASRVQGSIMVSVGSLTFLGFLYAAIVSKLLPPSENIIVAAIQNDRYYCFLVPLTLPIIIVAVYFHWLSMKLFKHA